MNRFVVDHTINRTTSGDWPICGPLLLILAGGALIFSTAADYTTPLIRRKVLAGSSQLIIQAAVGFAGCSTGFLAAVGLLVQVAQLTANLIASLVIDLALNSIQRPGYPKIGNWVRYCGESGWTILTVERLLANPHRWFCSADNYWLWHGRFSSWPESWPEPELLEWQTALPLARMSKQNQADFGWFK